MIEIRPAAAKDMPELAALFREYAQSLGVPLDFQGFDAELAELPGKYAPPEGAALMAWLDDEAIGCVAMRPLAPGEAEMKRLYLRPKGRGTGAGRALALAVIAAARKAGYARMRLDTLASMDAAIGLYRSLGFAETAAYYHNPLPDAVYLALEL